MGVHVRHRKAFLLYKPSRFFSSILSSQEKTLRKTENLKETSTACQTLGRNFPSLSKTKASLKVSLTGNEVSCDKSVNISGYIHRDSGEQLPGASCSKHH